MTIPSRDGTWTMTSNLCDRKNGRRKTEIKIHSKFKVNRYWLRLFFSVRQPGSCQCPFPMSFSQITQTLYLGGVDTVVKPTGLYSRNITLIINATAEHPCPQYEGVECFQVPVLDQPHAPLACYFDAVSEHIHNNHSGSTLVHCTAGRSRSPTLIMAYLMRYEGVSLRQAHEWVLKYRPHIRPNAGFWRQLMEYERRLYGKNTVRMAATSCGVLPEALDGQEAIYCVNG